MTNFCCELILIKKIRFSYNIIFLQAISGAEEAVPNFIIPGDYK